LQASCIFVGVKEKARFALWLDQKELKGALRTAGVNNKDCHEARVSLVIPVLNEERSIPVLLEHIRTLQPPPHEVIFVDGGSSDRHVSPLHKFMAWQFLHLFI
jgi:cellulose synthase/poly-beta-1,6-N-acetylglucosamine synthase-like glycosyltransferase